MNTVFATSKVSSKGQVTIPVDIRRGLGVASGDTVAFFMDGDGRVSLAGDDRYVRGMRALDRLSRAFDGAAAEAGLETDDDVVELVARLRRGEGV